MGPDDSRVPRLVEGFDLTGLALTPYEGFVLSRVDGEASIGEIADLVGMDEGALLAFVAALVEQGVLEWRVETVSLPRATGRPSTGTPVEPILRSDVIGPDGRPRRAKKARRQRVRITKKASVRPEGVYSTQPPEEEHVGATRSVRRPRSSHTGSVRPPGVIDEMEMEPKSLEDLVEELGQATRELSGEYPAVDDDSAEAGDEGGARAEAGADAEAGAAALAEPDADTDPRMGAGFYADTDPDLDAVDTEPPPPPSSAPPEEEVDLDLDRRRRINDLYYALDLLDHYQVLGVDRTSVRKEIRHAYFTLSKVFHPDTMFQRRLGPYKQRMEAIFQRLTEAYEVLGKKKPRAEYDRYLELQDRTRAVEAAIAPDSEQEERVRLGWVAAQGEADVAAGRQVPEPEPEPQADPEPEPQPVPRRAMSEAGRARARELMAKKLRHATRASSRTSKRPERPSAPPPSTVAIGRDNVLKGLAQSLRASASHTGGLDRVRRHELTAERAEREGDLATAANHYRLAVSLAPEREDLVAHHARVNRQLASDLAVTYEEQARYEQRHGKWGPAALSWAKVADGRPDDPEPSRRAAVCLLEAKHDLHRAQQMAQRAVDLGPDDVKNLRTLARVYLAAGLALNARRVLQRAAELDPDDEMVENLLRDLGT